MDVYEAIRRRRSVRAYSPRPIPDDVMERLKQAIRFAPSACNYQPWHFIIVRDAHLREEIVRQSNKQRWMLDAPVFVVACGFPLHAYKAMGGYGNSTDIDVAIALDHLTLAAVSEGLGTCWIGAFDEASVKKLLDIPAQAKVVAIIPLGYPVSADLNYPSEESRRKPAAEIFSEDKYPAGSRIA